MSTAAHELRHGPRRVLDAADAALLERLVAAGLPAEIVGTARASLDAAAARGESRELALRGLALTVTASRVALAAVLGPEHDRREIVALLVDELNEELGARLDVAEYRVRRVPDGVAVDVRPHDVGPNIPAPFTTRPPGLQGAAWRGAL